MLLHRFYSCFSCFTPFYTVLLRFTPFSLLYTALSVLLPLSLFYYRSLSFITARSWLFTARSWLFTACSWLLNACCYFTATARIDKSAVPKPLWQRCYTVSTVLRFTCFMRAVSFLAQLYQLFIKGDQKAVKPGSLRTGWGSVKTLLKARSRAFGVTDCFTFVMRESVLPGTERLFCLLDIREETSRTDSRLEIWLSGRDMRHRTEPRMCTFSVKRNPVIRYTGMYTGMYTGTGVWERCHT